MTEQLPWTSTREFKLLSSVCRIIPPSAVIGVSCIFNVLGCRFVGSTRSLNIMDVMMAIEYDSFRHLIIYEQGTLFFRHICVVKYNAAV